LQNAELINYNYKLKLNSCQAYQTKPGPKKLGFLFKEIKMRNRLIILTFRVNEAELEEINQVVAASGLSRSTFIRKKILKGGSKKPKSGRENEQQTH